MAFLAPSPMELVVIAVIALIVLGPSRLPDAARSIGKGMREMRDAFQGLGGDDDDEPAARAGTEEARGSAPDASSGPEPDEEDAAPAARDHEPAPSSS